MKVPFIDLKRGLQPLRSAIDETLAGLIDNTAFVLGEPVRQFEAQLAAYCHTAHAVGVASGSAALELALQGLDVGPDDEVVVPAFTFFATAGAVARRGAVPVFADIEPVTFGLDPDGVARCITPRTRAVIVAHLYGQIAAGTDRLLDLCRDQGIPLIEDMAQAIGATAHGQHAGSSGAIGCLSFYPTKNLGAFGDAGAVVTNDEALAKRIFALRDHGESRDRRYYHPVVGANARLDALQAAVLTVKLPHLDQWNAARRQLATDYSAAFAGTPLTTPVTVDGYEHTYHQYVLRSDCRNELAAHLKDRGIGHGVYYPKGLHLQECFADLQGQLGDLPQTEQATKTVLSLPMFPEITPAERDAVIGTVLDFIS